MKAKIDELEYYIRKKLGQTNFNAKTYNENKLLYRGKRFDMSSTYITSPSDPILGIFNDELSQNNSIKDGYKECYIVNFYSGFCQIDKVSYNVYGGSTSIKNVTGPFLGLRTVDIITKIFEYSNASKRYSRDKKPALSYIRDEKIDNVLRRQKNNNLLNDN